MNNLVARYRRDANRVSVVGGSVADRLKQRGVSLRVFLLIHPPFVPHEEQDRWLLKSVAFAEECGAAVISLIPARAGNGAMEVLTAQKLFRPPTPDDVLRSFDFVVASLRSPVTSHQSAVRILLDPWTQNEG